ncbi:peptidoglycan-binding protein [Kitasatospora sp. NPDC096147]|uniref:peptidoglycan-binding domain-containing protein n=1 Tax=Kitasatospora sp. NPDC096147 TaxID=3364093 RepID=UPI0037F18A36
MSYPRCAACDSPRPGGTCPCTPGPAEPVPLVRPYVTTVQVVEGPSPTLRSVGAPAAPAARPGGPALVPAPVARTATGRPGGAHRLRTWTARRARVLLGTSCVLAVCGSLGPALMTRQPAERADPPPTVLTLTFEPTGTASPEGTPATGPAATPATPATGSPSAAPSSPTRTPRPRTTPPHPAAGAAERTPAPPTSVTAPAATGPAAATTGPGTPATPAPTATTPPSPAPTPPTVPPAAPVLRPGDSGPQVRRLQTLLLDLACAPSRYRKVTGLFDDWTRAVLTSFQRRADIRGEDGTYGPATRAALEAAVPRC